MVHRSIIMYEGCAWAGAGDLHVLTHWDGRTVAPRTLDDWWKEALRYAVAAWLGHADVGTLVLRTLRPTQARRKWTHWVFHPRCEARSGRGAANTPATV